MRRLLTCLTAAAALLAAPAAAHADSLVFVKGGEVWIARADGSGARPVTSAPNNWAWPSEADDGTIAVAGGAARVNPGGTDSDGASEISRLSQAGVPLRAPVSTPGSNSSAACPTYAPSSVRVSPDGTRVVYDDFHCDYQYPFLADIATGAFANIATDYSRPQWLDATHLLITHLGVTFGNAAFAIYDTVAKTGHGPSDDPYMSDRNATAARDGSRVAVLEDDAPDYVDGAARHADIRIYSTAGDDVTQPTLRCNLTLDPARISNFFVASPAFSPDGSRLVWGEDDGIHWAPTADLSSCAAVTDSLLIPGGGYPFFGRGDWTPAPVAAPSPTPSSPPASPPACCTPPPPAPLTLSSRTHRTKLSRSGVLAVAVTGTAGATLRATGTVKVGRRTLRFRAATLRLTGRRTTLKLRLGRRDARRTRAALRARKRLTAVLTLNATAGGRTATKHLNVRLAR